MSTSCLGILAKHWTPGLVKTRLAASIGPTLAAQFHRASLVVLLQRLAEIGDQRVLCGWPADKLDTMASVAGDDWQIQSQVDGDLGRRISAFFQARFEAGCQRVVLLGSDSPNLPISHVRHALELLDEHGLVLGPTEDGGYYLVGAYRRLPPIFEAMPWSSPELWPATLRQLDAQGWQRAVDYELIPTWYDIDTLDDLKRLHRELLVESVGDPILTRLLDAVAEALADVSRDL